MSHLRLCFMFGLRKAQADPPRDRGPRLTARLHPHLHTLPHLAVSKNYQFKSIYRNYMGEFDDRHGCKDKAYNFFFVRGVWR